MVKSIIVNHSGNMIYTYIFFCITALQWFQVIAVDDINLTPYAENGTVYQHAVEDALISWQYLDASHELCQYDNCKQDMVMGRLAKVHAFFATRYNQWHAKVADDVDFWRYVLHTIASKVKQASWLHYYKEYIDGMINTMLHTADLNE